ncbi:DUF4229 domain-containing protein [Humibacter ginsenosidimutans]|uniref:DUF4229 domain-containing protein n=1 Tax=Humibacter ginsenosidimutans TaxID=2599293 RepID=A0A5B8M5M7_9MICO|nr:DUF4229 domain-containing protein [Humibacter ginsenosidimutans]QDZ16078.1 DUF4229 domain-containing protein [Humibacter ginsenosidimutans]
MKRIPAWLTYTVLRLLFVAVPFVILFFVLPGDLWLVSAIAAVVIGFCLSYLFLRGPREQVAGQLASAGKRDRTVAKPTVDDEVEDAAVDAANSAAADAARRRPR